MADHRFRKVASSGPDILRTLALVQVTWPTVDESTWRSYIEFIADRANDGTAGLVAISDPADYLNGVFLYEVERDFQEGLVLTIHVFTAIDLTNSVEIVERLLNAALATARDLRCVGLQIRLYGGQDTLESHLRRLGLENRAGYLWKKSLPID